VTLLLLGRGTIRIQLVVKRSHGHVLVGDSSTPLNSWYAIIKY
jgi:hypothetical protein